MSADNNNLCNYRLEACCDSCNYRLEACCNELGASEVLRMGSNTAEVQDIQNLDWSGQVP